MLSGMSRARCIVCALILFCFIAALSGARHLSSSRRLAVSLGPGKDVLVVFLDGVPSRSLVASFLEVASVPESVRFMCWTSTSWSDPITDVRPKGEAPAEAFILAVSVRLDAISGFDETMREALRDTRGVICSHRVPVAMRFEKKRSQMAASLRRCVVPRPASSYAEGVSFSVPDRRVLGFRRDLFPILESWCSSPVCDVLLGEVCARVGITVSAFPRCVATISRAPSEDAFSAQDLRSSLVTAALVTQKDAGFIDVSAPDGDLALVHAR